MPPSQVYQEANTYEALFKYMPWGTLTSEIIEIINTTIPPKGKMLDLMCGPGHILGKIANSRSDLSLTGVDSSKEFMDYAKLHYPSIICNEADVLTRQCTAQYDLVLVTGGIHHLPYDLQEGFIERIPAFLDTAGIAIFADPYIGDFSNEQERKIVAAQLGYEYLLATIRNNAPESIIKAAIDIMDCDVMGLEYKTSLSKMLPVFQKHFANVKVYKTRPKTHTEYGDYYIVCKNDM